MAIKQKVKAVAKKAAETFIEVVIKAPKAGPIRYKRK